MNFSDVVSLILMLAVGAGLLRWSMVLCSSDIHKKRRLEARSIRRTQAKIVSIKESQQRHGYADRHTYYYPVVEFRDRDGNTHTVTHSINVKPAEYAEDERVDIEYDEDDIQYLMLPSDNNGRHFVGKLVRAVGLFFIIGGLLSFLVTMGL